MTIKNVLKTAALGIALCSVMNIAICSDSENDSTNSTEITKNELSLNNGVNIKEFEFNLYGRELGIDKDLNEINETFLQNLLKVEEYTSDFTTSNIAYSSKEEIDEAQHLEQKYEETKNIIRRVINHKVANGDLFALNNNINYFKAHRKSYITTIVHTIPYILAYSDILKATIRSELS